MKRNYLAPELYSVKVEATNLIAETITDISNKENIKYGGGSTESARVKGGGVYNVWDEDWQTD